MDKQKLEIKTDAIRAIEGRFGFEQKIIGEIEKTKMRIAHPDWVEFSAGIPKPDRKERTLVAGFRSDGRTGEAPKLELIKPISAGIRKPETNVKRMELDLAVPENGERKKNLRERK